MHCFILELFLVALLPLLFTVTVDRLVELLEIRQWGGEDQSARFREICIESNWDDVIGVQL